MKFLVVDNSSAYHGVFARLTLKELRVVTSIHHLCIKFPIENEIATVRGNKRSVRECYTNFPRKAEPRAVNVILMNIDEDDDLEQWRNPKQGNDVEMIDAFEEETVFEVQAAPKEGRATEEVDNLDEMDPT